MYITIRYLRKMFNQRLTQSQLPPNIVYLASDYPKHTSCAAHTPEQFSDTRITLEAYRQQARRMVEKAATQYQHAKGTGLWQGTVGKGHCGSLGCLISGLD